MSLWSAIEAAHREGRPAVLATVVRVGGSTPRAAGARMLVYADGTSVGTVGGGRFEEEVIQAAVALAASREPAFFTTHLTRDLGMCCGGQMEVFLDPIDVRERFFLFGAGHVAHALAPMLHALDFAVTVVDDRPELNNEARFPYADRVVDNPEAFATELATDARTWWFVVTHDHALDQRLVELLLPRPFAWAGLIGSRAKVARFRLRLTAAGLDEALFSRLSAPAGLDVGAETPAEIAVSVSAELVQRRRGRGGPAAPMATHGR